MNNIELIRLYELVVAEFENNLTREQFVTLNNMLKDKEHARRYVELISMLAELSGQSRADICLDSISSPNADSVNDERNVEKLLHEIVDIEDNAPTIEIETQPAPTIPIIEKNEDKDIKQNKFFKIFDRIVYLAAVFMVMFIVYAEVFSPQYSVEVATVEDQVNIGWAKGSEQFNIDDRLLTNQFPYRIDKGIIKINYDQGVDVLVEGPAEFIILKHGLDLSFGRVYAKVTETGRGFTVDTPNSRFVDLGTEFGLRVEKNSSAELHVLQGEVQYFAGLSGSPKASSVVKQNDARRFDAQTGEVSIIPVSTEYFARHVDSSTNMVWRGQDKLDFVRILAGRSDSWNVGDSVGINPFDGELVSPFYNKRVYSDNKYHSVNELKIVDGVFIPDGGEGPVTITSAGDTFICPDTSGGFTQNIYLFRSGVERENTRISPVIFDGVDIEANPESIMCFHSNCGVTVDLNQIRSSMPGKTVSRFISTGGITEFVDGLAGRAADVDLWILVDGKTRYKKELLVVKDGVIDIDIDFGVNDRFLTIIVTDGLRETDSSKSGPWSNDFFYLVNPEIVLE